MSDIVPPPSRRRILWSGLGLLATAGLAPTLAVAQRLPATVLPAADRALVDQAVAYLEGLRAAHGRFLQTDPRGGVTRGELFIQRPGKARFAYDPPSGLTVVSNGSTVSVYDRRLRTFQSYPLSATPLSLFLSRQISLDRGVIVDQVVRTPSGFDIVARDARRQAEGRIRLSFSSEPVLLGWALTDAQGQTTRIQISQLTPATGLNQDLFVLRDPRPRSGGPH